MEIDLKIRALCVCTRVVKYLSRKDLQNLPWETIAFFVNYECPFWSYYPCGLVIFSSSNCDCTEILTYWVLF